MPRTSSLAASLARAAMAGAALAVLAPPALAQTLKEGTGVQLETRADVSSKTAKAGDPVELAVTRPVLVDGVTVIPAGAPAKGEVAKARDNGLLGRSGKLDVQITSITAGGRDIPVRGSSDKKGSSGTIGAVGAGVVFLPLAIVVKGKDAKIPAGTKVDVYVDRDIPIAMGTAPAPAEQPIMVPAAAVQ